MIGEIFILELIYKLSRVFVINDFFIHNTEVRPVFLFTILGYNVLPHNNASNPANKPAATGTLREFPAPALELEFPEDVLEFEPAVEFEVAPEL